MTLGDATSPGQPRIDEADDAGTGAGAAAPEPPTYGRDDAESFFPADNGGDDEQPSVDGADDGFQPDVCRKPSAGQCTVPVSCLLHHSLVYCPFH